MSKEKTWNDAIDAMIAEIDRACLTGCDDTVIIGPMFNLGWDKARQHLKERALALKEEVPR